MSVVSDFYVQCDRRTSPKCWGEILIREGTPEKAQELADRSRWITDGGKHWCPFCEADRKKESP